MSRIRLRSYSESQQEANKNAVAIPFFTTAEWDTASSKRIVQLYMGLWVVVSTSGQPKENEEAHRGIALLANKLRRGREFDNILVWKAGSVEVDGG
jgi:hypothetical protein